MIETEENIEDSKELYLRETHNFGIITLPLMPKSKISYVRRDSIVSFIQ